MAVSILINSSFFSIVVRGLELLLVIGLSPVLALRDHGEDGDDDGVIEPMHVDRVKSERKPPKEKKPKASKKKKNDTSWEEWDI